jgi:hypothetical protein
MKVYLFLAEGFEEIEAIAPIDIFRRAGIETITVSITSDKIVTGAHGKFRPSIDIYLCDECYKKSIRQRTVDSYIKRYGASHPMKSKSIKEKQKTTTFEKYGCNSSLGNSQVRQQCYDTMYERYGSKTALQSDELYEKYMQTNELLYGGHPMSNTSVQDKHKSVIFKKYGVNNIMKNSSIKNKMIETNIEKYGQPNAPANCIIGIHNSIRYQGSYEKDFVEKYSERLDITNASKMRIPYIFEAGSRIYVPDFYISSMNLIVEIKSLHTFNMHKDQNLAKEQACLQQGFKFMFIVDKDYSLLETIL